MTTLTQFGTYGFLSKLMAAQMTMIPKFETKQISVGADRAVAAVKKLEHPRRIDAKKTSRTLAA